MPSKPPQNAVEFNARYFEAQRIVGMGLDTGMVLPCPFCAAPDFLTYRILDTREALEKGAVCRECGRGCKAIFTSPQPGATVFEMVQTVGPDQPEWFDVKMRRVQ